jgi:glucosamine--fructose-6-phosphate aminotransferase (isomerizing)
MCGIVGYVGRQDAVPLLLAGLHRLEYRGYDSAGVAVITRTGLKLHKSSGRIQRLEASLPKRCKGTVGIAHTRWATHGEPTDANAHPHADCSGEIAVAHNGIIENFAALRAELSSAGHTFRSETDSEVLAHLIEAAYQGDLEQAVREALRSVQGTYGIAVVDGRHPDRIVAARNGSPVVIGIGEREMFVASDVAALVRHTQQIVYLDDREVASIEAGGFRTATLDDEPTTKSPATVPWGFEAYDRGSHAHYMLKEILEQPEACERTLKGRLDAQFGTAHLGGLNLSARDLLDIRRVKILGCGSAYYAGLAGAHMLESLTRIPSDAEPASEFRYRNPVIERETLYVAVSQSGETADTLAAVREVRRKGGRVLGIVNTVGSSIARECDGGIYMHAGPEVAVASTKAFTCTLVCTALLALNLGRIRDLSAADGKRLIAALGRIPEQLRLVLAERERIRQVAVKYMQRGSAFFIGRTHAYPVALEGAQKLKEISYIHAEAYPASELKHGPLALISPETPTYVVLPNDDLYDKSLSSIEEIRARRGPVIAVTQQIDEQLPGKVDDVLIVPRTEPVLSAILLTIPFQLLAYETAVALGRDVDQPRNLAKSVTVE